MPGSNSEVRSRCTARPKPPPVHVGVLIRGHGQLRRFMASGLPQPCQGGLDHRCPSSQRWRPLARTLSERLAVKSVANTPVVCERVRLPGRVRGSPQPTCFGTSSESSGTSVLKMQAPEQRTRLDDRLFCDGPLIIKQGGLDWGAAAFFVPRVSVMVVCGAISRSPMAASRSSTALG